jgi:hypothetical protein
LPADLRLVNLRSEKAGNRHLIVVAALGVESDLNKAYIGGAGKAWQSRFGGCRKKFKKLENRC